MAAERPKVGATENARQELGSTRTKPAWRECTHTLPFGELTSDEFEVLCYLLLKTEYPDDKIIYYGKTSDLGRDIVHTTANGTVRLIQCKKYSKNVDRGEIKEELAKLFVNIYTDKISLRPDEVCFYVVPDLTSPAKDLIESQSEWIRDASKALTDFLGEAPSPGLQTFANTWWPLVSSEHDISLTSRCKAEPELLDEFFRVRRVIDASLKDIQNAIRIEVEPLREALLGERRSQVSERAPIGVDTISNAFTSASRSLLNWPTTLGKKEWIERPELSTLFERVSSSTGSTTLLLGARGTGKSALLATFGNRLTADKQFLLAIKCDLLDRTIDTEAKLSEFLRLPALLTDCVSEASATSPVIVLFDQLDALGDLLDLHSGRLNVVLDVIAHLNGVPEVHVIVSCRDFEYRHDVRLTGIEAEEMQLELPAWERVAEILKASNDIDALNWPESRRDALRVPQHLKMLLEHLDGSKEYDVSRSYQQLLDDIWELHVANPDGPAGRAALLIEMAKSMAEQEVLWLPVARFDDRLTLIASLEASDILYRPKNTSVVGFRHQTLFEHTLARAYATGESRFVEHVLERQNALFVRPAIWSTLRYLREVNLPQYIKELTDLCSAGIRRHVLYLLIEFLGQVSNPSDDEQLLLQQWLDDPKCRNRCLIAVSGNPGWFTRLNEAHLPVLMQMPLTDCWPIVVLLRSAWSFARDRCLELLRENWFRHQDRDGLSLQVLRELTVWDDETVADVCSIIDRTEVEDFRTFEIAEAISANRPPLAPRVIRTRLNRELRELKEKPQPPPPPLPADANLIDQAIYRRKYDERAKYEQLLRHRDGFYELPAIAEAAPGAFLKEVWPWFIEIVGELVEPPHHIIHCYREYYGLLFDLDRDSIADNEILVSLEDSIRLLPRESPNDFQDFVRTCNGFDAMIVQRMLCRGMVDICAQIPEFVVDFLVSDRRRLGLGGRQDKHGDSRALIRAVVDHLTPDQLHRLEVAVLAWSDYRQNIEGEDPDSRLRRRKWDRERRLRLLKTLPFDRLTEKTQALIRSEEVALTEYRDFDHLPSRGMTLVGSPMSAAQMAKAKDADVLNLFNELVDATESDHPKHPRLGGVDQASMELARLAEQSPDRVANVLRHLRTADQQKPAAYAIRAIGENRTYPTVNLFHLIADLDKAGFQSADFRSEAAHACLARASEEDGLPEHICGMLEGWLGSWLDFSSQRDEDDGLESGRDQKPNSILWNRMGVMYPHGSFWLMHALTFGYLRQSPPNYDSWLESLNRHLERPESAYTWKILTDDLRFLEHCDPAKAASVVFKLFEKYPAVEGSPYGAVLTARSRFFTPSEMYQRILGRIRESRWSKGKQAFGELVGLRYLTEQFPNWIDKQLETWICDASVAIGLAYSVANLVWEDAHAQSSAVSLFERLATVDSGDVAVALMSTFLTTRALPAHDDTKRLLRTVDCSPLLLSNASNHWFVDKLEDLVTYCPDLVCTLCDHIVDKVSDQLQSRGTFAALSSSSLVNISITLQRLSAYRERGLSLFERLLDLGVYDAANLLQNLDRRTLNVAKPRPRRRRKRSQRAS